MIVKSMSRKHPSFGQLIGYIDREPIPEAFRIRHNLLARDPEQVREEFEANASLLQARKNGVALYHEILSITRAEGLSEEEQKQRLYHIAQDYIAARCPGNLVYGGLHQDKAHSFHFHLMISSNPAGESKRLRLSRSEFRAIQVELEARVLREQPELEQQLAIGKRSDRRDDKPPPEVETQQDTSVLARAHHALEGSADRDSLHAALKALELELYVRGKQLGLIDLRDGTKHRLKTLDPTLPTRFEQRLAVQEVQGENSGPDGENKKGAQALPSTPHIPEPLPALETTAAEETAPTLAPVQVLWTQEMEELRRHTQERVKEQTDEAEAGHTRLRDITALVKLAVQGTLLGFKNRYLHLLQHLYRRRSDHETHKRKSPERPSASPGETHR